jgi:hypothetical protein
MNHWIFIVTQRKSSGKIITPEEVFNQRMQDKFWGIGEKTPNRKNLSLGDNIVFYLGLPSKVFSGEAKLASDCFRLENHHKQKYDHGTVAFSPEFGVLLDEINIWRTPKSAKDIIPDLTFIENKEYWFSYFQGGVRLIPEEDYLTITGKREVELSEKLLTTKDLESQTEFALESHLEEFIYNNWERISWEINLELYSTGEQDGRQFPAGKWSIDFLAIDKSNNDFVVIELKRGKSSDATVGQLLRYMNWVKENLSLEGQNVKGIIIAKDIDESLKYSVMSLEKVSVKLYEVDFRLHSIVK